MKKLTKSDKHFNRKSKERKWQYKNKNKGK